MLLKELAFNYFLDTLVLNGCIFYDVGSNNCEFVKGIIRKYKYLNIKVILFESDMYMLENLGCTFKEFPFNVISINNSFVTNQDEGSTLFLSTNNESSREAILSDITSDSYLSKVRNTTLDTFINSTGYSPDIIKVDVEGNEMEVINGCLKFINEKKPVIIFEEENGNCCKILNSLGYTIINCNTLNNFNDEYSSNNFSGTKNFIAYFGDKTNKIKVKLNHYKQVNLYDFYQNELNFTYLIDFFGHEDVFLKFDFLDNIMGDMKIQYETYTINNELVNYGFYGGNADNIKKNYNSIPIKIYLNTKLKINLYLQNQVNLNLINLNIFTLN